MWRTFSFACVSPSLSGPLFDGFLEAVCSTDTGYCGCLLRHSFGPQLRERAGVLVAGLFMYGKRLRDLSFRFACSIHTVVVLFVLFVIFVLSIFSLEGERNGCVRAGVFGLPQKGGAWSASEWQALDNNERSLWCRHRRM